MTDKKRDIDKKLVGERIRLLREEHRFSRDEFAQILDISSRHLAGLETGNKGMSMEVFYHIKNELDSSADYILEGYRETSGEDAERKRIEENIHRLLGSCTIKELKHLEEIVKSYVRSHLDKEREE